MLSIKDVQEITFSKSMNGYKSTEVNVFIDECVKTIEGLTREKEDLEKKLEILADRLVEYRDDEDSIRAALLNAQRLGDTTVREANHKAGLILEDAQIKADSIVKKAQENAENLINEADVYAIKIKDDARNSIIKEHDTLEILKQHVSEFKANMIILYKSHLELIDKMPEIKPEKVEDPIIQEPIETPDSVPDLPQEPEIPEIPTEPEIPDTLDPEMPDEEVPGVSGRYGSNSTSHGSFAEPEMDRVRIQTVFANKADGVQETEDSQDHARFKDLKFGEDYNIKDDEEEDNGGGFFRRKK